MVYLLQYSVPFAHIDCQMQVYQGILFDLGHNTDSVDYLESLRFSWEEGKERGNDRIGDYRDWSTEYEPYNPKDWENPTDADTKILEHKAYIDMPNIRSTSFLDPRDVFFGVNVHF